MTDPSYYRRVSEIVERTRARLPEGRRGTGNLDWAHTKHIARRILLSLCAFLILLYLGDYVLARFRPNALGKVRIEYLNAIPQKGGKTEYTYGGAEIELCVHSLFPHFGHPPCWYATRHTEQRTNY